MRRRFIEGLVLVLVGAVFIVPLVVVAAFLPEVLLAAILIGTGIFLCGAFGALILDGISFFRG